MASFSPLPATFRFGAFEFDAATGELYKSGHLLKLQPQAILVLTQLVEHSGRVVTREEIRAKLWSDDTFVDFERGINFCINQIRSALGDNAERPRYIETLPRRGYRFVFPVTPVFPKDHSQASPPTASLFHADLQVVGPPVVPTSASAVRRWVAISVVVAFTVLTAGFASRTKLSRSAALNLQNFRLAQLTHSGTVTGVAISPDGRFVAYSKRDGERESLMLRQVSANSDLQLLPIGTQFHGLTFSPDGNYLYFVRADEKNPFFKYLYSMPALGGPVRKLFTDVDSPAAFSPDGKLFVFEHCVEGKDDIEVRLARVNEGTDSVLAVLHNATSLLFQPGPNWSPDGRSIAVPVNLVGQQHGWALEVVDSSSGNVRQLFHTDGQIGRPVWLSGGDSLLMPIYEVSARRGQLWSVSFPNGKARRFTNDLTNYGAAQLDIVGYPFDGSYEKSKFVALSVKESANVWVASLDSLSEPKEIANVEQPFLSAVQSSDGKVWAIASDRQLWTLNQDGSQLTPFESLKGIAEIAHCGPYVVLLQSESMQTALVRVNLDGTRPVPLVTGNVFGPVCSPDAKTVFYMTAEQPQKVWCVPIEGGQPVEIARTLGDQISTGPRLSPDGRFVAYGFTRFAPKPEWNVAIVPATGGPPVQTLPIPPTDTLRLDWAPDGKSLYFLWNRDGTNNVWAQPLTGGKPKQITHFISGLIYDFNSSPDHKKLFLTYGDMSSDAVLLVNQR